MVKQKPGGGPTKGKKKDVKYAPPIPGGTPGPTKGGSKGGKPNSIPGGSPGPTKGRDKRKTAQVLASEAKSSRGDVKWHDWIEQRRLLVKAMRSKGNSPEEKKLIKSTAKKMGTSGKSWAKKATKASVKGATKPKGPRKPPKSSNPSGRPRPRKKY